MRSTIITAAAGLLVPAVLLVPANAQAGPPQPATGSTSSGLTVALGHAPSHFLPGMVAAFETVTVSNRGGSAAPGPVTVTDTVPAGLTVTAVAGAGWACTARSEEGRGGE